MDLHALPLPEGFVPLYRPDQVVSSAVDALVAAFQGACDHFGPLPHPCDQALCVRVHLSPALRAQVRLERARPLRPLFFRSAEVAPCSPLLPAGDAPDVLVSLRCRPLLGEGFVPPVSLPPAAGEVYVALRRDGVPAPRALEAASLLAPSTGVHR